MKWWNISSCQSLIILVQTETRRNIKKAIVHFPFERKSEICFSPELQRMWYTMLLENISFLWLPYQKVSCLKTGFLINFVAVSAVCHDRGSTSSKRSSDGSCLPEIKIQEVADRVRSDKIIRRHSLTWGYKSSANLTDLESLFLTNFPHYSDVTLPPPTHIIN